MDPKRLDEAIHRAELKKYLSEDELTLPDFEREEFLLERKLVDRGALSEMDLFINRISFTIPRERQQRLETNSISNLGLIRCQLG